MTEHKTAGYYFKKRFLKNKPAVFGLIFIFICLIISFLGYLIMPDDTTNANNSMLEIKKEEPIFKTQVLKVEKNILIQNQNFFTNFWNGKDLKFVEKPFDSLQFNDDQAQVKVYFKNGRGVLTEIVSYADVLFSITGDPVVKNGKIEFKTIDNQLNSKEIIELRKEIENTRIIEKTYLLGTDSAGRDLLSRLLYGTRVSLAIGLVSVILSLIIGVFLGGVAGYYAGKVDVVVMWLMTVVWSVPRIMLVIVIGMALQSKGLWVVFVAVGLTMWTEVARVVRGRIMEIREKQYITAAKVLGLGDMRIIFGHILPNLMGAIVVIATSNFADAILIEAGLSFLGLGVPPPVPSWGQMVNEGFALISSSNCLHLLLYPSLAICLLVLSFNLLGNGLRDALDPKNNL